MKMKLIYIEWEDAVSGTGWVSGHDIDDWFKEGVEVKQVGWLYKETPKEIFLISRIKEWTGDYADEYGNLQRIPKTWIRKRKVIKL